jgi:hypothetical protein
MSARNQHAVFGDLTKEPAEAIARQAGFRTKGWTSQVQGRKRYHTAKGVSNAALRSCAEGRPGVTVVSVDPQGFYYGDWLEVEL